MEDPILLLGTYEYQIRNPRSEEDHCQLCSGPLGTTYIDGQTDLGIWAYMCESCHRYRGIGIGMNRGQRYETTSGKFLDGGVKYQILN